jgi:uncharacterized protein (DUF58 family)
MKSSSGRAGLRRRLGSPPIGYQHGRGERFLRNFPMICWLYYWLTAHTTPRLYLLGLVGVGPTVLLMLAGLENPATLVGFAVVAWIAACLCISLVMQPRVSVASHMPARVESGASFDTRYEVRNVGARKVRDLSIETLIFSDWMSLRLRSARVGQLYPGESEVVCGSGRALARGVYTLPALRADTSFPCGFWRWGRTERGARTLHVYPRYARLERLDIPLGSRHRQDLSAARELAREALEFHGCREYREGDVLRHVHPRSSARVGAPVVKEFQAEGRSRTAVLVDTRRRGGLSARLRRLRGADPFEAALALTAAIVEQLSTTDRVLDLLVAGPEVYRFVSAGRVGYFEEVLDILAAVEPCREDPVDRLGPLLLDEIRGIQSACLVLTEWDERRAALARELAAWETGVKIILVSADGRRPPGLPEEAVSLSAAQVLKGEVAEL